MYCTVLLDGEKFSGPAWETLVAEGKDAQFFLLGEEHGIAENPKFAGALFAALAPVLWGADYEVGRDRLLIATLGKQPKPQAAAEALAALKAASGASWAQ